MSVSAKEERPQRRSTIGLLILVAGIIFLGMNLRAPITSVGPVVDLIRDNLGISNTMIGVLTTIPLITFGLLSPFAPRLSRRFGMELTLFFVLIFLTIGLILRPLGGMAPLYIGTLFIGAGIAIANVLMPPFIKMKFPKNIGLLTGVYAISMNITAAFAAGLSVPLATHTSFGWKTSIGVWAIMGIIAFLFWIPQLRHREIHRKPENTRTKKPSLLCNKLAWQITIFMGIQSLLFYAVAAWLPVILQERGMTASKAGWMLSTIQFAQLPFTFIMPMIAAKMKNQIPLVWLSAITAILSFLFIMSGQMILVLPAAILLGIGTATAFSLAMMFFTLRTDDIFQASSLSAMAQSIGYLLAATGPVIFGLVYDLTGGWIWALLFLLIASIVLLLVGLGAGKDTTITKSTKTADEL